MWDELSNAASSAWEQVSAAPGQAWEAASGLWTRASEGATSSWADVQAQWEQGWKALHAAALSTWGAQIQADPGVFTPAVSGFVENLRASREGLDRLRAMVGGAPGEEEARVQWQGLERRYHELAAGLYADAADAAGVSVGLLPVLVVAGLAVGVAGTAWAVAAQDYAINLREQTALAERELTARIEASKQGRSLQATTLPSPPADPVGAVSRSVGALVPLGLAIVGLAVAVPLLKRG